MPVLGADERSLTNRARHSARNTMRDREPGPGASVAATKPLELEKFIDHRHELPYRSLRGASLLSCILESRE